LLARRDYCYILPRNVATLTQRRLSGADQGRQGGEANGENTRLGEFVNRYLHSITISVADPGCFIPDPTVFSSRILHENWNANLLFSCFLCFQAQSLSLSHSQKDTRSGIRKKFIPDLGGKKAPDPGSGSATLNSQSYTCKHFCDRI
jgi:hypothetical protein